MNVTRDVIYDLLPTYFAGDASMDTRSLVEEFFRSDPEFGRMAERFGKLLAERPNGAAIEADRAKVVFDRARVRVKLRLAATVWALGAAFPLVMAAFASVNGEFSFRHPGVVIGAVFAVMALATWLTSLSRQPENWYATFSGDHRTFKR